MSSHSPNQKLKNSATDKKDTECQDLLEPEQVRAGTSQATIHSERQAFLKTSELGRLLGVAKCL